MYSELAQRSVVDIVSVACMVWSSWAAGNVLDHFGGPALVAEIVIGSVFGPHAMQLISDKYLHALALIGDMGLLMLVFEGGLTMDVDHLKEMGHKAFAIASTGTLLPVLLGWGLMYLLGFGAVESFASGTALSATAIGFALRLLQDAKMVKTQKGQLITAAAMIDDVLSLVVLAMLNAVTSTVTIWSLLQPLVATLMIFTLGWSIRSLLEKIVSSPSSAPYQAVMKFHGVSTVDQMPNTPTWVFISGFAALSLGLAWVSDLVQSTHLLGVFMAGLIFNTMPEAVKCWEECGITETILPWAVRLFFSASVGFSIPVREMFEVRAIKSGLMLTVAAFVGKYFSGWLAADFTTKSGFITCTQIGCAMIGRGELGFVIAGDAMMEGLLTDISYSSTVWALVLATLFGPILFRWSLSIGQKQYPDPEDKQIMFELEQNIDAISEKA